MMVHERNRMHDGSALRYHIELVKLLAYCTMGKNVFTEIKCHSLLPLDDVVKMVSFVSASLKLGHCAMSLDSSMHSTTIYDVIYQNVTNFVYNKNPLKKMLNR